MVVKCKEPISGQIHMTAVETSKIYAFTYKIPRTLVFIDNYDFDKYETSHIFTIRRIRLNNNEIARNINFVVTFPRL